MFGKVYESIREGESIAKPMKEAAFVLKNKAAMPAICTVGVMIFPIGFVIATALCKLIPGLDFGLKAGSAMWIFGPCWSSARWWPRCITSLLAYRLRKPILDDMVVNMVDVGEETGELDTMLYKVADTYDEEVAVLTESLTRLDGAALDHHRSAASSASSSSRCSCR